ncbi:MAG TPA: YlxR family protein [Polyangia bacterium]|jgi:predicted RNA-binding protein YlxR (DUF448 family)
MTAFAPQTKRPSERTCVGCRRRAATGALARLAVRDERLVLWGPGRARPAGRGAALHADAVCLRAALKSGAFGRAFRRKGGIGVVDEADLLQQLKAAAAALTNTNASRGEAALRSENRMSP